MIEFWPFVAEPLEDAERRPGPAPDFFERWPGRRADGPPPAELLERAELGQPGRPPSFNRR